MVIQEKDIDSINTQDSTFSDTVTNHKRVIKASKIMPAQKIESEDGAIIPKQAIEMIEIQPTIPVSKPCFFERYGIYIVGVLLLSTILYLLRRKKKRSKKA